MALLCLVRHGESQWNALSKWTGLTDIPLSDKGIEQSKQAGDVLKEYSFDMSYASTLSRAIQTLENLKKSLSHNSFQTVTNPALNERDYGDFTAKNKWDLEKEFGKEKFHSIRRGWDYPIPNGETLKDVYNRVVPFYTATILPQLKEQKNILIVAHGNSLRALMKYIEHITDEDIDKLNIATGEICVYDINSVGDVVSKKNYNSPVVD